MPAHRRPPTPAALCAALALLAVCAAAPSLGMQTDGCGAGRCADCHTLDRSEATQLLAGLPLTVLGVEFAQVPGLWVVDVEDQSGRKGPVFVDFSKTYLVSGRVLNLKTREDVTGARAAALNPVDPAGIPLDDALVIGDREARHRVIVFDDPRCKFCRKLHPEMKRLAARRPDVAFFIKLFPLNEASRAAARAILCEGSAELLEASLEGRALPPATCETDQLEANTALGRSLGVRSTPTLVFPDGRLLPGFKTADQLEALLPSPATGQ